MDGGVLCFEPSEGLPFDGHAAQYFGTARGCGCAWRVRYTLNVPTLGGVQSRPSHPRAAK